MDPLYLVVVSAIIFACLVGIALTILGDKISNHFITWIRGPYETSLYNAMADFYKKESYGDPHLE